MLARYNDLWDRMESLLSPLSPPIHHTMTVPEVSKSEDERHVYLKVSLPGFSQEEIEVEVKNSILTVSAKKNEESKEKDKFSLTSKVMKRSWSLDNIVEEDISAEYKAGVLLLTLPLKEVTQPQARRISITSPDKLLNTG